MKKALSIILTLAVMLTVLPFGLFSMTASAATTGETGDCTWSLDGTTLTISGNGVMGDGMRWDYGITTVIIEDGVTTIGTAAFQGCEALKSVTIGENVTSIGEQAFVGCIALTELTIPASVKTIGNVAFDGCSSLASVKILNKSIIVGHEVFYNCIRLTDVWYAGDEADRTALSIGSNNDYFTNAVWHYNSNTCLEHTYDDENDINCNNCGEYRFDKSGKTGEVNWGVYNNVLTIYGEGKIGSNEHPWGTEITAVVIEEGVTEIGWGNFNECAKLESVTIPVSVEKIWGDAFLGCTALTELYFDAANCDVNWGDGSWDGGYGFNVCENLKNVYFGENVKVIPSGLLYGCNKIENLIIPGNVIAIGNNAFSYCENLKSITIGSGIKSIGYNAFEYCSSLSKVNITDLKAWCEIETEFGEDYGYSPLANGDILYLNGKKVEGSIEIPAGTKSIANGAFKNCYFLEEVIIPDSVESIGYDAFSSCRSLTKIVLPETITEIPDKAFFDCRKLETIVMKGNVTSVGYNAFENDYKLKNIYYAGSEEDYILMDIEGGNTPLFMVDWVYDYIETAVVPHEHVYGDWVVETPAKPGIAGRKYQECECGDVKTEEIAAIRLPNFKNAALELKSNLAFNFNFDPVLIDLGYTDFYAVFELDGKTTRIDSYALNPSNNLYAFKFSGIAPNQMNKTVKATLYCKYDGVEYSGFREYSVVMYANSQLKKFLADETQIKLCTLLVDLVNYGAATQLYVDATTPAEDLANNFLTDAMKAFATTTIPEVKDILNTNYTVIDIPTATVSCATLVLKDSITIRYRLKLNEGVDVNNIQVYLQANGRDWTIEGEAFANTFDGTYYYVSFSGLNPNHMRSEVLVTVKENGVAISNTTLYSIESYAASQANTTVENLPELLVAMMRYGDAVAAYAG